MYAAQLESLVSSLLSSVFRQVKWLKREGDAITSGDVLCEVETDKVRFIK